MRAVSKYRAKPTVLHGVRFASQAEARRYAELLHLGAAGEIRNLELQPRFPLTVDGVKVATYVADFAYDERIGAGPAIGWRHVVEDVKGMKTPMYRLKKKFAETQHSIQIRETR